jgi:glycosyltransferase involved in cell wall biosynthesis
MRVGVIDPVPRPADPYNWSGTPHGLVSGLAALGITPVPIGTALPPGAHEAVAVLSRATGKRGAVADRTLVRKLSREWALKRGIREAGALDGLIAVGTDTYDLGEVAPAGLPVATYDDATLIQMWRHPDSDTRNHSFRWEAVQRWTELQARSSGAASTCCVSTEWAARSFREDFGLAPEVVHVVGIGYRPHDHLDTAARDWSTPRFLFVGIDWSRKNGDAVVRAFRRLRAVLPEARLDLVGGHPMIDEPGVTTHGVLSRRDPASQELLDRLYADATVFVLPSRFEPAGIVYLEAASAGLAVIGTTEGGARDLVGDGGVAVDPLDDDALLAAMTAMASPTTAREYALRAAQIVDRSTWADVVARILASLDVAPPVLHS